VLSIAKLRVGAEAYQLSGVAQSLDDYYSGRGEAAGWWAGTGALSLGLGGEVGGDDLRAALAGMAPGVGGLDPNGDQIRPHPRRVPGFDLTFKAPKSVSTLYAVTDDPRIQGAIIEAYEAAVRDTIAWLEREAISVRRGTGNARFLSDLAAKDPAAAQAAKQRKVPGGEVLAAVYRHRTSRAGDPLLHWHCLIPNMVRGADGRWSAFVHPDVYRAARAAGEIFQAAGREHLTRTLGVEWRPGRHVPEIAGVPQGLADRFSKRSQEIRSYLETTGLPADAGGRQEAVLATRQGKPELEGERFDTAWKTEAVAFGWGPDQAEQLAATFTPHLVAGYDEGLWRLPEVSFDHDGTPYTHDRIVTPEEWAADLLRRDLTVADATFTRADIAQAVAHRLGDGATITTVERVTARVLASPHALPVATGESETRRWTSRELLEIERRLVAAYDRHDAVPAIKTETIEAAIANATKAGQPLGADQEAAVRTVVGSTDAVSVLVGPAGTGKTYALGVAANAWHAAGYQVIGAAPSARAGIELSDADIDSTTMAALHRRWGHGHDAPGPKTALVIDETSMASTRDLEPLVTRTTLAGGRVVLVGDPHQLPEIQAGGGLAAATRYCASVAQLHTNRRQHAPWEKTALRELRNGSVANAVAVYRDNDRILVAADRAGLVTAGAQRWFDAHAQGHRPVLMAGTNDMVAALNRTVRDNLVAQGALPAEPVTTVAGLDFRVGDQIVFRQNQWLEPTGPGRRRQRVANGQAGVVVDGSEQHLTIRRDRDGTVVHLAADQLAAGALDLGYALTTHRAQGGSWDIAIAVGLDGLYREAAYVQLSRARHGNWLIITAPDLARIDTELARHDHRGIPLPSEQLDIEDDLIERLERSRAKLLALARDPDLPLVTHLADTVPADRLDARARHCRTVERAATHATGVDPAQIEADVQRAQRTGECVAVGHQVKAYDRHNIGTVTAIDDDNGTVTVHFRSPEGRTATRELPWTQIEIVNPRNPTPRELPEPARRHLDQLIAHAGPQIEPWNNYLRQHGVEPHEAHHHELAHTLAVDRATALLTAEPPAWLTHLLGERPARPTAAVVWDDATREIATWHLHTHAPGPAGLHPPAPHSHLHHAWHNLSQHLLETRTWLDTDNATPTRQWTRRRSHSELLERQHTLNELLAAAPEDQRHLIDRLRSGEALPLDETTAVLQTALDAQGARRDWILAHWPHVVEYAQINGTIAQRDWGPEILPLLRGLANGTTPALTDAAAKTPVWLATALSRLAEPDASHIEPATRRLVEEISAYRERWHITSEHPLGPTPRSPDQAQQLLMLHEQLHQAGMAIADPPTIDPDLPPVVDLGSSDSWALELG
jgi:conjugative relaxase-like TrwC/TraI family protein